MVVAMNWSVDAWKKNWDNVNSKAFSNPQISYFSPYRSFEMFYSV